MTVINYISTVAVPVVILLIIVYGVISAFIVALIKMTIVWLGAI